MTDNIHWFRNDLRLEDNHALSEATNSGKTLCIYILDTKLIDTKSHINRTQYLINSLVSLQKSLQEIGSDLLILKGSPKDELRKIIDLTKAQNLFFNKDYSNFSLKRDSEIINSFQDFKINTYKDSVIFEKNEIKKSDNTAFRVFTPYRNQWIKELKNDLKVLSEYKINKNNFVNQETISKLESIKLEFKKIDLQEILFSEGELNALSRWNKFLSEINIYKSNRDLLDQDSTSRMSVHLKFGEISIRKMLRDILNDLDNIESSNTFSYLNELIWREFYKMINFYFPESEKENFQKKYTGINWLNNADYYTKWCEGKTGYPIVDAAMRQLNSTGWMHNRARMIVASFLCKDLHVDWKLGERYFYEKLLDYDITSNVGGWQWTAGTGTDAAPYFRIFNPIEQGKKFDPNGNYVKKYIPELKNIPKDFIHDPKLIENFNTDYPKAIVDHKISRQITLEIYKV